MRNRFKGLDLTDRLPDELWTEVHDIVQDTGSRPSTRKRNAKKQNGCLTRLYKQLRKEEKQKARDEKGKIYPTKCGIPENNKER